MGFDLYGQKPKSEKGEYFRNNVWWWRRLADFVIHKTGVVDLKDQEVWHTNDFHLVPKEEAEQIAKQLRHLISTGEVRQFEQKVKDNYIKACKHNARVKKLEDKIREKVIEEVGDKEVVPRDYPEPYRSKWLKLQEMEDWNANYPFTQKNVEEFIEFCENSNGFTIG